MWGRALSRLDESEDKKFSEEDLLHFPQIVQRLKRYQDFEQKQFEADARTVLKYVRSLFEIFGPLFYADEDGSWVLEDENRDFNKEQEIINHLIFCICNKLIFDATSSIIEKEKINVIVDFMFPKYTMDTTIKFIDFTTHSIPWRTEFEVRNLFKSACRLSNSLNKRSIFRRDQSAENYQNFLKDMKFLIREMKFEGALLGAISPEEICNKIFIRCGVVALDISFEGSDRQLKEDTNVAMLFLSNFLNTEPSSKPLLADFYKG